MKKINIKIGDAFTIHEKDNYRQYWSVIIINRIINYKNQNRWLALKLVHKKLKLDIDNISCFFVIDDYGQVLTETCENMSILCRTSYKCFKKLIPDLFLGIHQ